VDVLRIAYQRRFMRLLLEAYEQGRFQDGPHEAFPFLAQLSTLRAFMGKLIRKPWVVYIEPPFGSPQVLLRYLGRYVNRVAISPSRVTAYDAEKDQVTFHWKDYAQGGHQENLTLSSAEFLQRFAQHIPPPRFVRIRFRGLWCTAHRKTKLAIVQAHFLARGGSTTMTAPPTPPPDPAIPDHQRCSACGIGCYHRIPGDYRLPRKDRRRLIRELIARRRTTTPEGVATPA
jgi:Putative transposase